MAKMTPQPGSEKKVPVEQGLIDRVVQGVKYILTGNRKDDWFGPGDPLPPQAQEQAKGRQLDYKVTQNIVRTQRDGETNTGVDFTTMRALADGYDLLRLVIETRKDQMSKMKWNIKLKEKIAKQQKAEERQAKAKEQAAAPPPKPPEIDPATGMHKPQPAPVHIPEVPKADPRIEELEQFFAFPDGEHDWDTWLRALLEDLFVIDAPTLYPRLTNGGDLYALELIDGTTIKRVIDETGRTPMPPEVAYQQILKGMPAVDYNRDELIYKPRNVRTNKLYGFSPVEQIIMTVNIALRRQIHQLQYYTEGNTPEALIGVPEEWNPEQIRDFQEYWDSVMENTAARRHAKFIPGGMNYQPTRETTLKDEYDDWLARVVCFAFSISPSALIKQMNKATADSAHEAALQEGLAPVMQWVKNLMDYVLWKYFDYKDLEFVWEEDEEINPVDQMTTLTGYVTAKVMDPNEARERIGLDPLTPEQDAKLNPPPPPELPGGAFGKKPGDSDEGGTGKPVGKLQGSALSKAKRLQRDRASVKACTSAIETLVKPALAASAKRVKKALRNISKAVTADAQTQRLLEELTFEELKDLAPELAEILEDMAAEGGEAALAQVLAEVTKDQLAQVHERAKAYAEDRSAELVTDLEDATRDMLRSSIAQAIEDGWSNDQLADELEDNYAFSDARAETIARTETAYADVQGNLEGYAASGVVQGKQWIIAQDEECDDCAELDGVIVGLDEEFPGEGGDGPPLHPNCRCDILPVLTEEE